MSRMRMERHRRSTVWLANDIFKRQYSSRVQIDDTDPRITYQQSNWYAAQNMTGRGYNGTATMTMTNDSWLQLPYSGGSLTLGLLHNGVAFSGLLGLDDGSSYKHVRTVRPTQRRSVRRASGTIIWHVATIPLRSRSTSLRTIRTERGPRSTSIGTATLCPTTGTVHRRERISPRQHRRLAH